MRDDIVGYRPHQIARLLRSKRRRASGTLKTGSPLFPGGQVRELWKLALSPPTGAVGPPPSTASPPVDVALESDPPQAPAVLPTGQPGTLAVDPSEFNLTKEIVAPLLADATNDVTENSSLNAPPELPEIEDFQEPDIELPLPVIVALQEREARRQNCEEGFAGAPSSALYAEGGSIRSSRSRRSDEDISLSHHAARCGICQHPDRDAIEQGYLHWESPTLLAYEYGLGQRRAVYRHARAFGLREKRAARTRRSLEFIVEQAETVTPTADSVIRAVRAYSCLGEDGRWTEPTKRVIIRHEYADQNAPGVRPPSDEVDCDGSPRLSPVALAKSAPALPQPQRDRQATSGSGPSLATSHQPLATVSRTLRDGHAVPSISAVTPAPPTKVTKLMDTLFTRFSR